ncbi:hypothetical protein A3B84_00765 [Candidatus Nomurabacteria bacterium RIFCSPHIGHO2_02_FULL_35_13]|uniref:Uncharacterized protein n=1 Tax=Candidatus Nomurabacteria bacterium RIFCSPHIGHO2_02_FULL_35_13 TaxID=1801748 RepID=A0A1F6VPK4_9BACT|nr:MAG: hypothetical protein A3B84_00765 [Candidatus Nomurabacteria bacterium RIFCSPHIGHO2_02_FULL_35_13]
MSIENPSQGTPEEIKKVEKNLDLEDKKLSYAREILFYALSNSEKELAKKCSLEFINGDTPNTTLGSLPSTIRGNIDGHKVDFTWSRDSTQGTIDGTPIDEKQTEQLFLKYRTIARYQTYGSKDKLEDWQEGGVEKKLADDLAKELLGY